MEQSVKSSSINYGLYLGLVLSLYTVVCYVVSLETLANFWMTTLGLSLVIIVFGVISVAKSKSLLGGFISFKNAFVSYFLTVLIGLLVSTVVSYVIFNIVDPEAAEELKIIIMENTKSFMERMGTPPDAISEQLAKMDAQESSIGTQLLQFAQGLIFFSVIGLIVAAIMKKKDPEQA